MGWLKLGRSVETVERSFCGWASSRAFNSSNTSAVGSVGVPPTLPRADARRI
jgi:hypothetical protein